MVVVVKARDRKYRLVFYGGSQGGLEYPRMVLFRGRGDAPPKINIVGFMYKNMSGSIRYYKGRKLTVLFSGGVIPQQRPRSPGHVVRLQGLPSQTDLNGREATVTAAPKAMEDRVRV